MTFYQPGPEKQVGRGIGWYRLRKLLPDWPFFFATVRNSELYAQ